MLAGACAALLATGLRPASAQGSYYHQDLNSPAARALRQEIMNRAIIRQATGKHGTASRKSHAKARTTHRARTAKHSK
jgi:hypothetical protein